MTRIPREKCHHIELTFGSGDYYLFCYACGAHWLCSDATDQPSPSSSNKGVGAQLSGKIRIDPVFGT